MKHSPGQVTLWAPSTPPYCYACRSVMRGTIADHASTRQHRDATRPRPHATIAYREAPAWRVALRGDDGGTARQNRAAARRLGIAE